MKQKPMVIGIAGGSGSGKTTISNAIIQELGVRDIVLIQHDSYYKDNSHLPLSRREKINYDHPDALDTDLLIFHLTELIAGREVEVPLYDFTAHSRKDKGIIKKPGPVIIIDGILIFVEKGLRELMDVKIFVHTNSDIRFIRRLQRDINERDRSMESVIHQYLETVRPMHMAFVEPSRKYADVIIPEGHNPVSTDMVTAMIKHRIDEGKNLADRDKEDV